MPPSGDPVYPDRRMEGEAFLIGMAQIGIVVAGFAGLAASFQDRERWTRAEWVYLQTLVVSSLAVVFFALLPFIPFFLWHDERLSVEITSAAYATYAVQVFARRLRSLRNAGSPRTAYRNLMLAPLLIVSAVANVPFGSLALYTFTLVTALYFSALQFRHFLIPAGKV